MCFLLSRRTWRVANIAFGAASFLILEAVGATLLVQYGFANAALAILATGLVIFLAGLPTSEGNAAPVPLIDWLRRQVDAVTRGASPTPLACARGGRRLTLALHAMTGEVAERAAGDEPPDPGEAEWLIVGSEAQVLVWVVKGKTNRDVGDILGMSPRTVTKHMEHILPKLGVETRTAAAALVLARVPGFGSSRG